MLIHASNCMLISGSGREQVDVRRSDTRLYHEVDKENMSAADKSVSLHISEDDKHIHINSEKCEYRGLYEHDNDPTK